MHATMVRWGWRGGHYGIRRDLTSKMMSKLFGRMHV